MHDRESKRGDLAKWLPALTWMRVYDRLALTDDLIAALIVTAMLIPQSLAYAILAGLPPEVGLYASMTPLIAYALFGTSRVLAVGPVAVVSLMTAAAISQIAEPGSPDYALAALTLAVLSGLMLLVLGFLRLGFLANFLSHPVIAGFMTASGILIASSQMKHLFGVSAGGHNLPEIVTALAAEMTRLNSFALLIGTCSIAFLYWVRSGLKPLVMKLGVSERAAELTKRAGPVMAVVVTTGLVAIFDLHDHGVAIVGAVPRGLAPLSMPTFDPVLWSKLAGAALLISMIGFVESVSVAQTLAAKRRQRIDPDQELIALGAANIAAGLSGGYPVTGGFARSVVNFDAGARTPAAGAMTAVGIGLTAMFLTPLLYFLPIATLAATIIVAVLSLVDTHAMQQTWRYSKSDFSALAATLLGTLLLGVEIGVVTGVVVSIGLHLIRTSRPHAAVVGQVPGTEHFRNIDRHTVVASKHVASVRIDESLYFANARFLEDRLYGLVVEGTELKHVVLQCSAVNDIDASALESLEAVNHRLGEADVRFHLSEVKGPVLDRLRNTNFLRDLSGEIFLSQFDAMQALDADSVARARGSNAADAEKLHNDARIIAGKHGET